MLCSLIYILPILIEEKESCAFEEAIVLICCIFALQGFIHFSGYLIPSFGEFILSLKPEAFRIALEDPTKNINHFRGYSLSGSVYFELPSAYGVAFILFVRLQLMEGQKYLTGYRSYIVFLLFIAGIMLSGRVGFVGIGVGAIFYFLFTKNPVAFLVRIVRNLIIFSPFLLIIWFLILSPSQRADFENNVFPYAFEFFYRFAETREIGTWSSDVTFKAFYFPLRDDTLLWGHGTDNIYGLLDTYTFTDAGYMRSLMFGGIPFLACLLIYQFLYFSKPIKVASLYQNRESRLDLYCFVFLYIYILILHIKDYALGSQHLTEVLFLYVGISYLIRYYAKLKE
jgi:hypothetical protein